MVIKHFLVFVFILIMFMDQGLSNEEIITNQIPSIQIFYQNNKVNWNANGEWIWVKAYEHNLVSTPVLRLRLKVPFRFEVEKIKWDAQIVNEIHMGSHKIILLDIPFYHNKVELTINEPRRKKIYINIQHKNSSPILLIHKSCLQKGINLSSENVGHTNSNIAVTCLARKNKLNINVQHLVDTQLISESREYSQLTKGKFRSIISYNLRGVKFPKNGVLGKLVILDKSGDGTSEYIITTNKKSFSDIEFKLGLNIVNNLYKEQIDSEYLDLSQVDLNGSLNVSYQLLTNRIYILSQLQTTLVSFFSTQQDHLRASFYNADANLAYNFLNNTNYADFFVSLGAFFWGMNVNVSGWGVDFQSGPRIMMQYQRQKPNHKEWKLASWYEAAYESGTGLIWGGNFGAAFSYELSEIESINPYMLEIGYLQKNFETTKDSKRQMDLKSIHIGVSKRF